MASRSIGILTAIINADATQFMSEFNKLDKQLARSSKSFTEPGAKLALGFVGLERVMSGVVREIHHVIENIDSIPGIPTETIESVSTMKENLADARNVIDGLIAKGMEFGVKFAQSVGVGAAMIANYFSGIETDTSSLSTPSSTDDKNKASDPKGFAEKLETAKKRLADANKAEALAAADEVKQIQLLRKESEDLMAFAKGPGSRGDTIKQINAEADAIQKRTEAAAKFSALQKQLSDLEKQNEETFKNVLIASSVKDNGEKLRDAQKEAFDLRKEIYDLKDKNQNDPAVIKQTIEARQKLEAAMKRQIPLLEKEKQIALDVGNAFGSAFEQAILSGNKLADVLRNLGKELLTMALREEIIKPLSGGISSLFEQLFTTKGATSAGQLIFGGFLPGKAGGGPVAGGSSYMVGEKGPELFVPDSSGRIIPNASLRGGSGSSVPMQFTYNFASGVTRQEIAALIPEMQRSTIAAVMDKVQRGGTYRKAFA